MACLIISADVVTIVLVIYDSRAKSVTNEELCKTPEQVPTGFKPPDV